MKRQTLTVIALIIAAALAAAVTLASRARREKGETGPAPANGAR